jgi:hypothetical protein
MTAKDRDKRPPPIVFTPVAAMRIGKADAGKACEKPDRHEPGMKCGYPRPCPWHAAVLTVERNGEVTIKWPEYDVLTVEEREAVKKLAADAKKAVRDIVSAKGGAT